MLNNPIDTQYDFGLGIEPEIIYYIKESHVVQSRISPTKCYLLHKVDVGEVVMDSNTLDGHISIDSWDVGFPQYVKKIWTGGNNHPDIRPYTEDGSGAISVHIDGNTATRVLEPEDIVSNDEYAIVKRVDLISGDVEIVFKNGFNAEAHSISYTYGTMNDGISDTLVKDGGSIDESKHGWLQHLNNDPQDPLRSAHQILVRTPLTQEGFTINEEGNVILKENKCWMIWDPYVYAGDILIVPNTESPNGKELRFIITDKNDSKIQGELVSQRFRIVLLEETDTRYNIEFVNTVGEALTPIEEIINEVFDPETGSLLTSIPSGAGSTISLTIAEGNNAIGAVTLSDANSTDGATVSGGQLSTVTSNPTAISTEPVRVMVGDIAVKLLDANPNRKKYFVQNLDEDFDIYLGGPPVTVNSGILIPALGGFGDEMPYCEIGAVYAVAPAGQIVEVVVKEWV